MTTEPIRPEDHGLHYEATVLTPDEFADVFAVDRTVGFALAEAIHQAFERDAAGELDDRSVTGFVKTRQPVFEIDRQARLIVDGEYRRRKAEGMSE